MLIAAHSDVVGVEREKWRVHPFAAKGGLAVFTQAMLDIATDLKAVGT